MSTFDLNSLETLNGQNSSNSDGPIKVTCEVVASVCYQLFHNASTDQMEDCFLSICFEPQAMKPHQLYPLTVIYLFIFVVGVAGNLITCVVMRKADRRSPSSTCRYLCNLAMADLISLLSGVPFEIYLGWNQYPWHPPDIICHAKAWILETTSYVSVLTIVAFSLERYVAICHSLAANSVLIGYRRHISYVLFGLWIIAAICASPYGFYHTVDYVLDSWPNEPEYGPIRRTKMCMFALAFDPSLKGTFDILFHASAAVFFFIPLLFLVFLYCRMAMAISRSYRDMSGFRTNGSHRPSISMNVVTVIENSNIVDQNVDGETVTQRIGSNRTRPYSRKTFYMLAAVVVAFFFCYAPYQIHRLLFFYDMEHGQQIVTYLYFVSGVMFYLSSVINPILYSVLSLRFRSAFTKLLCLCETRSSVSIRIQTSNISRGERQYSLIHKRKPGTHSPTLPMAQAYGNEDSPVAIWPML